MKGEDYKQSATRTLADFNCVSRQMHKKGKRKVLRIRRPKKTPKITIYGFRGEAATEDTKTNSNVICTH